MRKQLGEVESINHRATWIFHLMQTVYILKSIKNTTKYYIGTTNDLEHRLNQHNQCEEVGYSNKYAPWGEVETFITFKHKHLALNFEKYLKSGSGVAFLKKRFLEPV